MGKFYVSIVVVLTVFRAFLSSTAVVSLTSRSTITSIAQPGTSSNPAFGQAKDSGGECTVVTNALLRLPGTATVTAPWYSTAVGPIALVVLSSEHDFTTGSVQHTWLAATLAAIDRSVTPWLIFTSHRPMCACQHVFGACP